MQKELFVPLQLESGGFGPPRGEKPLDQPWGHVKSFVSKIGMDPANRADNTPVIGTAGIVHLTMQDLATYGWTHLDGEKREGEFLKTKTFRKLHEPAINDYGCGWVVVENKALAEGRTIWHNGSNTMWYSLLILLPARNAVLVFVSNDGDMKSAEAGFFSLAKTISADLPANKKR